MGGVPLSGLDMPLGEVNPGLGVTLEVLGRGRLGGGVAMKRYNQILECYSKYNPRAERYKRLSLRSYGRIDYAMHMQSDPRNNNADLLETCATTRGVDARRGNLGATMKTI